MFGVYCFFLKGYILCGVYLILFIFLFFYFLLILAFARPGALPLVFSSRPVRGFVCVLIVEAYCILLKAYIYLSFLYFFFFLTKYLLIYYLFSFFYLIFLLRVFSF